MKELEVEDDLLSKIPIRNLRAKLYKESYEFVRQQRIQCLMQGAWFINALPANSTAASPRRPNRPWRFMRLDPGMKYLHYVDSAMKFAVRSGLEDLPERIEVASISEIATGSCAPPPHVLRESDLPPTFPPMASPLSFSLLSAHEGSIADQIAPDQSRWADWTDGLNMLRRDGGHVASKETAGFVQALTEIGLKIKLLDLSGEMVEIPSGLVAGPPPTNTDFFFSDLV
ncbi:ELMO domain-containing protein [Mycena chlorophos]|nr:ELMO domain-containing protein [Mycena chlorophos]